MRYQNFLFNKNLDVMCWLNLNKVKISVRKSWHFCSFNFSNDWNRHYPLAFIIETFLSDSTSRAWFSNLDFSESKLTLIKSIELSCLVTCFWIWVISSAVAKFWLAANHAEIEPLLDRTCSIILASACSSWRIFSSKSAGTRVLM